MSKEERTAIIDDIIRMLQEMAQWRKEKQGVTPASPVGISSAST